MSRKQNLPRFEELLDRLPTALKSLRNAASQCTALHGEVLKESGNGPVKEFDDQGFPVIRSVHILGGLRAIHEGAQAHVRAIGQAMILQAESAREKGALAWHELTTGEVEGALAEKVYRRACERKSEGAVKPFPNPGLVAEMKKRLGKKTWLVGDAIWFGSSGELTGWDMVLLMGQENVKLAGSEFDHGN